MENSQHVKIFNVDSRGDNRFRYSSSKQKSKKVSADIYRSYKRQFGVTSAADREEIIHRPKRMKMDADSNEEKVRAMDETCIFAQELELAQERNSSELFNEFYREIWPLVRSLPELLHHSTMIVDLLLSYLLSPETAPHEKTTDKKCQSDGFRARYVVNHATTDILHLLAVLAKDLQEEIHPYVYRKIIPRIALDLLNPPPLLQDSVKQVVPLDVLVVETAFRSLSYILRHDAEKLLNESIKASEEPCLEGLRKFYGPTLGHKRLVVRRLAAETFAPLIRKIKTDGARKRHFRRILRALIKSDTGHIAIKRAQSDAVDGITLLLFETAKGATGRLYSKGHLVVRYLIDFVSDYGNRHYELITNLATLFLRRIYHHISSGPQVMFDCVWEELHRFHRMDIKQNETTLTCHLHIVQEALEFCDGIFFKLHDNRKGSKKEMRLESIVEIASDLTKPYKLMNTSETILKAYAKFFFKSWNLLSINAGDTSFFETRLIEILKPYKNESSSSSSEGKYNAVYLIEVFCEATLERKAKHQALPAVINALSSLIKVDREQVRNLLFRIVQMASTSAKERDGDHDDLFTLCSSLLDISFEKKVCIKLLDDCTAINLEKTRDQTELAQMGFVARCIPFLCFVIKEKVNFSKERDCLKWILKIIESIKPIGKQCEPDYQQIVTASLLIESFSNVVKSIQQECQASWLRKLLLRCAFFSWEFVKLYPESLWAIKSAAALCKILSIFKMKICNDASNAFDLIMKNLRSENHFLRLHTLQILSSFPRLPYVLNHSELNLGDDLDEEPGFNNSSNQQQSKFSGCCDIIDMLLKIESTSASVETERGITSLLLRVGLIGQSGRLPVVYVEAITNHMIGIFHIKYSSLWDAASSSLCALSREHHTILCQVISDAMEELLCPAPYKIHNSDVKFDLDPLSHHQLCVYWDLSRGHDARLFQAEINSASEVGIVSPFLSTDRDTALHEVLKVIQAVPEITSKYSRRIVTLFVSFLRGQYYLFFENDPGARELNLDKMFQTNSIWGKKTLNRKMLHQRLLLFLKVFAEVKGSQQLFQRSLMLSIFTVFLSHQEVSIAEVALKCIINFYSPQFDIYSEKLKNIFRRNGIRDALLKFPLSIESGLIESKDRRTLIPFVLRILFGQLLASSIRGVNSKDTLTARRKTIVSTFLQLEKEEIFPFIYLMLRNYIPKDFDLKWEEVHLDTYQNEFLRITSVERCSTFIKMPVQWHEGFINLLSSLISQLKRSLAVFVPTFMSTLLGIIKCTSSRDFEYSINSSQGTEILGEGLKVPQRVRSVRSHAIQCITDLMDNFFESIDFTVYFPLMWEAIAESISSLPKVVAKGNSIPSILSLLLVLASHVEFHPILKIKLSAIDSVIKCIGPTSNEAVLDASLEFILHLLNKNYVMEGSNVSICLSNSHILLLMNQYRQISGEGLNGDPATRSTSFLKNNLKTSEKELLVLRMLGEFMLKQNQPEKDTKYIIDTILGLLLKFMECPRFLEKDHVNILGTVSSLLPRASVDAAELHFFSLSKLLKFSNWSRFTSLTRSEIASAIRSIPERRDANAVFSRISYLLEDLFATNSKRVEEMDYERVLPVLSELSDSLEEKGWQSLLKKGLPKQEMHEASGEISVKLLIPIVYACFSLLQQDEVVVSRPAYTALRTLIRILSNLDLTDQISKVDISWSKFVETYIVPGARMALKIRNEQIRRHGISLLREISKGFQHSSSPNLHGDMYTLICEENADLDFFNNILHVQSHRRCRALQRLRAYLNTLTIEKGRQLSNNSIANILLPLVLHPIYEYKTVLEEGFARECVTTVGTLGRHLTWSKYNDVLWTALSRLNRCQNQEKLILGMICALLDAFNFELTTTENNGTSVRRALEKRILPKVETLLVKRVRNRRGDYSTSLRPNIVLTLLKLFKKFSSEYFDNQLPRLLATVCDALKNRDSNVREIARKAFGAMIIEMGPEYLSKSIGTLAVTLSDGFQLHVRMATLHHILLSLSSVYKPKSIIFEQKPAFDKCIPAAMDLILQDMFGVANETKENADAAKQLVKEAMGSKANDSIGILCRLLSFNTYDLNTNDSSIHLVVLPFFEKLQEEGISTKSISKIKNTLRCVVMGLVQNPSASLEDILKFTFASVAPIIELMKYTENRIGETTKKLSNQTVVVWQPSTSGSVKNAKSAVHSKRIAETDLRVVYDGFLAPKLTGSDRHSQTKSLGHLNNLASTCALEFGLNLFLTKIKTLNGLSDNVKLMLIPFFDILTTSLCLSHYNSITILSIRSIGILLKRGLKPSTHVLKPLSTKIIGMLSNATTSIGANSEMTQMCLTALTTLLKVEKSFQEKSNKSDIDEQQKSNLTTFLSDDRMEIIVSNLKEYVMVCDSTNAPLELIKVLLSAKYVSPEFYDLMETLLDFSVRGQRENFRDQCSNTFLKFLIDYPLTRKRFKQHLRQIMLNIKYKHYECRMSAIRLVSMLVERLPLNLVDDEIQLLFLPLVLQLVNDEAEECRKFVLACIIRLICRVSTNTASSLFEFTLRWNKGSNPSLRRASLQLIGVFAEGRNDVLSSSLSTVLECLCVSLECFHNNWQENYFALVSLEKIIKENPGILKKQERNLWPRVLLSLSEQHAWVRLVSSRIVWTELRSMDPNLFNNSKSGNLLTKHGTLYEITSALCSHLDTEDISTDLGEVAIKSLTWLSRAMSKHPNLCYANSGGKIHKATESHNSNHEQKPVKWLITRLSNIAKRKGTLRRQIIFKFFAALCHLDDGPDIIAPYLDLIIEPLNRSLDEAVGTKDSTGSAKYSEEAELATEVLGYVEELCGNNYLEALAQVKKTARDKRELRKEQKLPLLTSDPKLANKNKVKKKFREKRRQKRRVQEHQEGRGRKMKLRHLETI